VAVLYKIARPITIMKRKVLVPGVKHGESSHTAGAQWDPGIFGLTALVVGWGRMAITPLRGVQDFR